jgi:hypothetical protein
MFRKICLGIDMKSKSSSRSYSIWADSEMVMWNWKNSLHNSPFFWISKLVADENFSRMRCPRVWLLALGC